MKILIIHRIPYAALPTEKVIDHNIHDVTYVGTQQSILSLPKQLSCKKVIRPENGRISESILKLIPATERFDRVVTSSGLDEEISETAILREAYHAKGSTQKEILNCLDKVYMKTSVLKSGLRAPRFQTVKEAEVSLRSNALLWSGKTILKPRDGHASIGVEVFSSPELAVDFVSNENRDRFEIEEFVEGDILHFDGIMSDGEPLFTCANKYLGNCLDFAKGMPMASFELETNGPLCKKILPFLKAVKIQDGFFHLEMILSDSGLVFLEVAPRFGGGFIVDNLEQKIGWNPLLLDLAARVGTIDPSLELKLDDKNTYGCFMFPKHHIAKGSKYKLSGYEKFKSHPAIKYWNLTEEKNPDEQEVNYDTENLALSGFLSFPDQKEVETLLNEMLNKIQVQIG